MPERRIFRGFEVRNARKLIVNGKTIIRVTLKDNPGKRGRQIDVSPEEYDKGITRSFVSSKIAGRR